MDILGALTGFGNYINSKKEEPVPKKNYGRIKREITNGDNIYDAHNLKRNKTKMWRVAQDRDIYSTVTPETGIVPDIYNQIEYIEKVRKPPNNFAKVTPNNVTNINKGYQPKKEEDDSIFSDDSGVCCNGNSNSYDTNSQCDSLKVEQDHMAFLNKAEMMTNNTLHEKKFKTKTRDTNEPEYFAQFNELEFNNPEIQHHRIVYQRLQVRMEI